jgi:hypothetical protein
MKDRDKRRSVNMQDAGTGVSRDDDASGADGVGRDVDVSDDRDLDKGLGAGKDLRARQSFGAGEGLRASQNFGARMDFRASQDLGASQNSSVGKDFGGSEGFDVQVQKERTLLASWLISLWAPLGSGAAFFIGRSSVQMADLLRRTSELVALFLAWAVHRKVSRTRGGPEADRLERFSSLVVGIIMIVSVLVISWSAISRMITPVKLGVVWPGLLVASGGALVNGYFWLKFLRLNASEPSPIFETQWRLYRAKTVMDLTLIVTLAASHLLAGNVWAVYLDPAGSLVVAGFMLASAVRIIRDSVARLGGVAA